MSVFFVFGCSNNEEEKQLTKHEEINLIQVSKNELHIEKNYDTLNVSFSVRKTGSKYKSRLVTREIKTGSIIFDIDYLYDVSVSHYKLYQSDQVVELAKDLQINTSFISLSEMKKVLNQFMKDAYVPKLKTLESHLLLNSIHYHISVMDTRIRYLETNQDTCECTVHPAYLVDKANFVCQEDYFIPKQVIEMLLDVKDDNPISMSERSGLRKHLGPHLNSSYISFKTLYSFYVDEEVFTGSINALKNGVSFSNAMCWFGQGSDWGCCGNYSGCYYYWSFLCYLHDWYCTDCHNVDVCLPGCVPDKDTDNSGDSETDAKGNYY